MQSVPDGFRILNEIETNPKNYKSLLGRTLLVYYSDSNNYYPGKVTRFDKKAVTLQYYGNDYEDKVEEDIREGGVWIFEGNETSFMNAFPQYKGQNKVKGASKMTYNDMILEALYALNDKNGSTIQTIRKFMEMNFSAVTQKASFISLSKKAIDSLVASSKVERVDKYHFFLSKHERDRFRDNELGFDKPSKNLSLGGSGGGGSDKKSAMRREKIDEYDSPAVLENNRTLRQQKFILEAKRDEFLKDKERMDKLMPFLPEIGNYFQRKEQGLLGVDSIDEDESLSKYPFPLHTEYLDFDSNKKAMSNIAPIVKLAPTSPSTPSDFDPDDTKEALISSSETYTLFKAIGIVSKAMTRRGPHMLNLAGGAYCPKSLFLDACYPKQVEKTSAGGGVAKSVKNQKDLSFRIEDSDIDYGIKLNDSGTTDFGFSLPDIAKATSAFQYFSRAMSTQIKDGLQASGEDSSLGSVVSIVSSRWKSLSEAEREPYEELARVDRERFDSENEERDLTILKLQEERRAKNALLETEDASILNRRGDLVVRHTSSDLKKEPNSASSLPTLRFLSDDATCMDMLIEGTDGPFDGYRVSWPGRRLPDGISYSSLKTFSRNSPTPAQSAAAGEAKDVLDEERVSASLNKAAVEKSENFPEEVKAEETMSMAMDVRTHPILEPSIIMESHVPAALKPSGIDALTFALSAAMEVEQHKETDTKDSSSLATERIQPKKLINSTSSPSPVPPIDWRHVYFLERDVDLDDDKANDEDDDDDECNERKIPDVDAPAKAPPRYLTALREQDGTFVPIPRQYLKLVFPYAKRGVPPISNLIQLAYICPNTNERMLINRQYCDQALYKEIVIRTIKDNVKRFPEMRKVVDDFFKTMREKTTEPKKSSSTEDLSSAVTEAAHVLEASGANDTGPSEELSLEESAMSVNASMEGIEIITKPRQLNAELHEHQISGISWMVHMFQKGMSFMLGDQMGLGKTLQSIGFICYLKYKLRQTGPFLVVMPLSVLSNWMAEFERFCPQLKVIRLHGPKSERNRIKSEELSDLNEFDVLLTTYEMLVSEINFFKRKYVWASVIIDEGHRLKNEKSQLSEKLRGVPTVCRVVLTGTPLQNNLRELWALLHYLQPDIFTPPTAEKFEEGFDLTKGRIDHNVLRKARHLLSVFMLRRIKENVSIKLPSKKEITILVPLTETQKTWYKQLLCGLDEGAIEVVMSVSETDPGTTDIAPPVSKKSKLVSCGSSSNLSRTASTNSIDSASSNKNQPEMDWRKLMNLLLQLRKVCNHTYLMPDGEPNPYEITDAIVDGSGKLKMLDRILPKLKSDGNRVLIFSQFTSMLDILEEYLDLRQYSYARLDGETNRVQRRLDVRRFNAPKSNLFIFLISTRAGGLGLNLASADTVILYDSDWNPQVDLQAMERAHRIGQTKPVRVYRLICSGSVEERMINRAGKKLFLNAMVGETIADADDRINESSENDASNALGIGGTAISKSEIASLIRFGANAIIGSSDTYEISEPQLDRLLERADGKCMRDKMDESSVSDIDAPVTVQDEQTIVGNIMKEEVDLRQLGNLVYSKKKVTAKDRTSSGGELAKDEDLTTVLGKRTVKARIVMVESKGSGYGGAVPVLAENQDEAVCQVVVEEKMRKQRSWDHVGFCVICGTGKSIRPSESANVLQGCTHCPRTFHVNCLYHNGLDQTTKGTFICTQHKCAGCARNTSAAGGLLFRCVGCLTAYCEDCLLQDEIEGIGRHRDYEDLGYSSKQAYYIKCPSCCSLEGIDAQGMWGDGGSSSIRDDSATASHTQSFRVFIDQIEDELDIKYLAEVEEKKKQEEALKKLKEEAKAKAALAKLKGKSNDKKGGKSLPPSKNKKLTATPSKSKQSSASKSKKPSSSTNATASSSELKQKKPLTESRVSGPAQKKQRR